MEHPVVEITNLNPYLRNIVVIGVVIAKQSPRLVSIKKGKITVIRNNSGRCVFNFTLRDSVLDTINATCWGNAVFVQNIYNKFSIGHVVEVKNPQVILPPRENYNSISVFQPQVSSCFQLNINENFSDVNLLDAQENDYILLNHEIDKLHTNFYNLSDVIANVNSIQGEFINLLVIVREVLPVRNIITRKGNNLSKREVKVFDQTLDCFSLILWDEDNVNLANFWTPQSTILFIADVRASFDEFRYQMVASVTNRTVITVQPNIAEADYLRQYAESVDINTLEAANDFSDIFLTTISNIFTIEQIQNAINSAEPMYGIIYAFLTSFDLDGAFLPVRWKWISNELICDNCFNQSNDVEFSLRVSISDSTGTLEPCYFPSMVIQNMLGFSANDFLQLDLNMKTEIKWQYLLEQCKIYFRITCSSQQKVFLNILKCEKVNIHEMIDNCLY